MSRDIKRIDTILWFIRAIWIMFPDMRLGQILFNFAGFTEPDLFYKEDDLTLACVQESYKHIIEERNRNEN